MAELETVQLQLSPDAVRALSAALTFGYAHTEHAKTKMGADTDEFGVVCAKHFQLVAEHTTPEVWAELFRVMGSTSRALLKESGVAKVKEGLSKLRGLGDASAFDMATRLEGLARGLGISL